MIDIKKIRLDPDQTVKNIQKKYKPNTNEWFFVESVIEYIAILDRCVRLDKDTLDNYRGILNIFSDQLKKEKRKPTTEEIKFLTSLKAEIKDLESSVRQLESIIEEKMLNVPNIPHSSVPLSY